MLQNSPALRLPLWRLPELRRVDLRAAGLAVLDAVRRQRAGIVVLALTLSLYVVAALSLALPVADRAAPAPGSSAALAAAAGDNAPALLAPQALRPIAAPQAVAINAAIPIADLPNPAARPFALRFASEADKMRSLQCLTEAIYYESATEPADGQRAVAQVILNRLRHPAYPNTVCGVVYQGHERRTGCQFSFTCDGSLGRPPMASLWERARGIAQQALSGSVYTPVGWATHYHANYVVPYWASSLVKSFNIGAHIFYRWTGGWGRPPAFTSRYAGAEPVIIRRRNVAPLVDPALLPETLAQARDAAAAAAAAAAALAAQTAEASKAGTPVPAAESFNRAVIRRYEPLRRETANAMIAEQAKADPSLSASQRWALTGEPAGAAQAPLGRRPVTAPAPAATPPGSSPTPGPAAQAQQAPAGTQPAPSR